MAIDEVKDILVLFRGTLGTRDYCFYIKASASCRKLKRKPWIKQKTNDK